MDTFNDKLREGLRTGKYYCKECGALMEFEDEWEDVLICPECGYSVELDRYGFEDDDEYYALFPTEEEVLEREENNK